VNDQAEVINPPISEIEAAENQNWKAQLAARERGLGVIVPATTPITPMAMLSMAVSQGASVEVLENLMTMQERLERNEARKAFDEAMYQAQSEMPVITKNRQVAFGNTSYSYEDLGEIDRVIKPILNKHGIFYRWRTTSKPNEPMMVTCIVSHRQGYSEENSLSAGYDNSGSKNSIQALGSVQTYLQRYTLKAALGLSASKDDDGRSAGGNFNLISDEEAAELSALLTETKSNVDAFLKVFRIECLPDLPKARFAEAKGMIEKKKAQTAAKETSK
jgi:hypothetical protein